MPPAANTTRSSSSNPHKLRGNQALKHVQWQAAYDKLEEYVLTSEPNTLTYYFGIPMEFASDHARTNAILAFESYKSRSDLYDVHFQSDVMQGDFLPKALPAMSTNLDVTHFSAVGGFLDRTGRKTECGVIQDVRIRCVDAAKRREFLGALKKLCDQVETEQGRAAGKGDDGDVLTYLGLQSLDNQECARIFSRYKDRETWESWTRHSLVSEFWESVKPSVASMESRAYVPNGKGWLWK